MSQQSLFIDQQPNIEQPISLPETAILKATRHYGPDEFHFHPYGRVKAPADTSFNRKGAEALYKIVSDAHTIGRRGGIFSLFCNIWWSALQRFSGGEAEYMRLIDGLDRELLELATKGWAILRKHFVEDGHTSDILGAVFMMGRAKGGGGWPDQEFTPWSMTMLMARMSMSDLPEDRILSGKPISIYDPACGSGGQLLGAFSHVAEKYGRRAAIRLQLYGQDIDPLCHTMARIQVRMVNTPWMLSFLSAAHFHMRRGKR